MLGLAISNNPQSRMELKSVIGYKVAECCACEDLVSMAIIFTPVIAAMTDPLGIVNLAPVLLDEYAMAVKVLKRIAKRVDADVLLANDEQLMVLMRDEMADLLEVARYDRAAFLEWVSKPLGQPSA
jgi:hypothetical protein